MRAEVKICDVYETEEPKYVSIGTFHFAITPEKGMTITFPHLKTGEPTVHEVDLVSPKAFTEKEWKGLSTDDGVFRRAEVHAKFEVVLEVKVTEVGV